MRYLRRRPGTRSAASQLLSLVTAISTALGGDAIVDAASSLLVSSSNAAGSSNEQQRGIEHRSLTLGEAHVEGMTVPVRGQVVLPADHSAPAPLVIISHLRGPNCSDDTVAYPCPPGTTERRFDEGMVYLGEHLAEQGYAVVIPDLSAVWSGADLTTPYDQLGLWEQVVAALVGQLPSDSVDTSRVHVVAHSRSSAVPQVVRRMYPDAQVKVLAYGPAYEVIPGLPATEAGPDVDYLALVGGEDQDVGTAAMLWLGAHAGEQRTHTARAVELPGLGHNYINRTLSAAGKDDRTGCDLIDCPDATAHEEALKQAATSFFAGEPVKAPSREFVVPAGARFIAPDRFGETCTPEDSMNPNPGPKACPIPDVGVVAGYADVAIGTQFRAEAHGEASALAVHLAPFGSSDVPADVTVEVAFADGTSFTHTIGADHPALVSRAGEYSNGLYYPATAVVELPNPGTVTEVSLHASRDVVVAGAHLVP
ncbi:alpha/beta hydrolase [Corynebacterium uterequi]|uniref:Alpha/beta hydrolase family n=1 Tax=Corynebacterium uterequi TaxID=1072256 RepID=A0A0G3HBI2_9CORY|nr:alpha/beta hydrolase [Corynebacterium uterequi]AKK10609.1 Alpha/beta hydrolase family [Corynebacterium uterequi]